VSGVLTRLRARWDGFWFAPESPRNLAAARILVSAHALWILLSRDPAGVSALPEEFWFAVARAERWRFLIWEGRPGPETALQWLAVAALGSALVGLWTRLTCLAAGLLLYHLAPLETFIFTPSPWVKGFTLTVPALVVLSFTRCADVWAVGRRRPEPGAGWGYGWPLRLVQLLLCQVYLFAGWAKLTKTGWAWVSVESVQRYILQYAQNDQFNVFTTLGTWIADRPALCLAAAVVALIVDFGFITVLIWRRARPWILPLVAVWHLLILLSFNMAFLEAPLLLLFVDWSRVGRRPVRRPDPPPPPSA
jgi:hypothetical protein